VSQEPYPQRNSQWLSVATLQIVPEASLIASKEPAHFTATNTVAISDIKPTKNAINDAQTLQTPHIAQSTSARYKDAREKKKMAMNTVMTITAAIRHVRIIVRAPRHIATRTDVHMTVVRDTGTSILTQRGRR
jgi:hypothetical protein